MNRTKMIYFLSAIVLIIGCYALNLSYSLFVQTEEQQILSSTVPSLIANLETSTYTIPANSSEIIKLKVINSGTAGINFGISVENTEGAIIRLVNGYSIIDTVEASKEKEVWLYVTNPTKNDISALTFKLTSKYNTIIFDETFIGSSNIDCNNLVTIKPLNDTIIANAKDSTMTYENKTIYSSTFLTTPAEEISEETERLLLEIEDDHTATTGRNSYNFRGNVVDNYVNFAGMCWRIVRIAGDGSIKLILDDQNEQCNDNEQNDLNNNGTYYTGNSIISNGNFGYEQKNVDDDSNLERITSYLRPVNSAETSMVKAFYDFQTDKLGNYLDKLKSGEWCLGDKAYTRSGNTNPYVFEPLDKNNYYSSYMYYDSYVRLTGESDKGYQPTLKCNGTILNNFEEVYVENVSITKEKPMYVGAITLDELIYAGTKYSEDNPNMYLISSEDFLTFSPYGYIYIMGPEVDAIFNFNSEGSTSAPAVSNNDEGFRPMISLASNVLIIEGNGTIENPYVII